LDIDNKVEKSCVNPKEKKANDIIQWIPILSFFYSLVTSIYYGSIGCHEVAKERAVDMAIGLAMDAAFVATGGAAGVAAYGIKAGVKGGFKAALTAAKQGITASIKGGLKNVGKMASKGVVGNVKSISAKVVADTRNLLNVIKSAPTLAREGAKKLSHGVKEIGENGILKSGKAGVKKVGKSIKETFDELAEATGRRVDEIKSPAKSLDDVKPLCRRKRMISNSLCPEKKLLNAQERAIARRGEAKNLFDEILALPDESHFNYQYKVTYKGQKATSSISAIRYQAPDNKKLKDLLHDLQHYHDNIPDGGTLVKASGATEPSKFALQVDVKIGGEPFEFVLIPSRDRQIFVSFSNKIDDAVSHSYDGIIKQLDDVAHPELTREHARTILVTIL
jgi:hypothetical protein